ncbi:M14 family metallopeptidase [bacterium]|nr:M14 family metallopeptidase [bacterium]
MKKIIVLFCLSLLVQSAIGQFDIQTVSEKTNYTSTSTYAEVMQFISKLESSSLIRIENFATTIEGKELPLLLIADPMPESPNDLVDNDRIVVYLQANIHAGEVEGKEAAQMLARDILNNQYPGILEDVVLLICPILNADGNDKMDTTNRINQNGPVNGVGVRYNGQYLDLNRDAMKLETPEIKGVVDHIFKVWDPAITVDCHTTNGSYHEEPVTFTWMMNPNGDRSLINYMRDEMMPYVSKTLLNKYNVENVFYGEFIDRLNIDKGWISYASEPRYLVNYVGVRNRLAILNENYVYADFKTRVNGSYYLLVSIVEYAASHKDEIKSMIAEADRITIERGLSPAVTDSFAIEYRGEPTPNPVTIKAYEADTIPGIQGYWRFKQSDRKRTVTVPYIADYYAAKSVKFPYAYILTVPDPRVIDVLKTHGIQIEYLKDNITLEVEGYRFESIQPSQRLFQGHYPNNIKGRAVSEVKTFQEGTMVIRTAQPLGSLIAYLLEPLSDDGLLKWNFFDNYLVSQWGGVYYPYPVYKVMGQTEIETANE